MHSWRPDGGGAEFATSAPTAVRAVPEISVTTSRIWDWRAAIVDISQAHLRSIINNPEHRILKPTTHPGIYTLSTMAWNNTSRFQDFACDKRAFFPHNEAVARGQPGAAKMAYSDGRNMFLCGWPELSNGHCVFTMGGKLGSGWGSPARMSMKSYTPEKHPRLKVSRKY